MPPYRVRRRRLDRFTTETMLRLTGSAGNLARLLGLPYETSPEIQALNCALAGQPITTELYELIDEGWRRWTNLLFFSLCKSGFARIDVEGTPIRYYFDIPRLETREGTVKAWKDRRWMAEDHPQARAAEEAFHEDMEDALEYESRTGKLPIPDLTAHHRHAMSAENQAIAEHHDQLAALLSTLRKD